MTPLLIRTACGAAIACAFSAPAHAQTNWDIFSGAPTHTDENGNTLKIRGRILWDVATLEETRDGEDTVSIEGNEFRSARLGLEGQYDDVKYKFEMDFAGSESEFKDMFVTYVGGPVDITVGQQKTPNSFEEEMSSRHITFTERAQLTDAFGFGRRVGVAAGQGTNNYSWRAGVFTNSINSMQDDDSQNTIVAGRGTYAPINEAGNVIHVGAHYRHTVKDNSGNPGRASRWGDHQATIRTRPVIGESADLIGLEGAIVKNRFSALAEYVTEEGDLGSASGYAVTAGVFLTDDVRAYKGSAGVFDRIKPKSPVSEGGLGALHLTARYDVIDATDASGEETTALSAGLTWTLESHFNIKAEYVVADGDTYEADGFGMRFQYDW